MIISYIRINTLLIFLLELSIESIESLKTPVKVMKMNKINMNNEPSTSNFNKNNIVPASNAQSLQDCIINQSLGGM